MASFWNDPSILQIKQQHRWVVSFGNAGENNTASETINGKLPTWFAKAVDKPSFTNKSVQAKYLYSHTFNFPTRVIWNPIKITLYDAYIKDGSAFIYQPEINSTFDNVTGSSQASKYASSQLFFATFLQQAGYFNPKELASDDKLLGFRKYTFKQDIIDALLKSQSTSTAAPAAIVPQNGTAAPKPELTFNISELHANGQVLETWKLYNPLITDVNFDKLDYSSENVVTINATIAYDWAELSPRNQELTTIKTPQSTIPEIIKQPIVRAENSENAALLIRNNYVRNVTKNKIVASEDQTFTEFLAEEKLQTIKKEPSFSTEQIETVTPSLVKGALDLLPKKTIDNTTQKQMLDAAIKKLIEIEPRVARQATQSTTAATSPAEATVKKQIITITPKAG